MDEDVDALLMEEFQSPFQRGRGLSRIFEHHYEHPDINRFQSPFQRGRGLSEKRTTTYHVPDIFVFQSPFQRGRGLNRFHGLDMKKP